MNTKLFVLPALCLGGAALLLAPIRPSQAFSKIGGSLSENQRDVRLFDNFSDSFSNNNTTPNTQFPGYTGAELAVWKGIVEWGSMLHGDGTGDGVAGNPLGSGGANFDAFWAGNAEAVGSSNQNVVSKLADCSGSGTLAFTETPISDGWRIRFCDEWTWDDGPGTISNRWDIQGVMCHEYGHALGLGHSTSGGATMWPSVSPGSTSIRSITTDDANGVQCVYGVASLTKPVIVATVADTGSNTLTIFGSEFAATDNEVWFTNANVTATNVNPTVQVGGLTSAGGGTVITVTIPADAGPGDVIVNKLAVAHSTVSNAFPTDLVGTFGDPPGPHPDLT
ncbi:MAG: matrixin family metalloprotease, partial [Actinobacteria bacterium]|nr:matrixin family metalloprotease [Actinomycetota bacterium]